MIPPIIPDDGTETDGGDGDTDADGGPGEDDEEDEKDENVEDNTDDVRCKERNVGYSAWQSDVSEFVS